MAVVDAQCQEKCLVKLCSVARIGRTLLFVSHNLGAISRLCAQTFWIDAGQLRARGNTDEVVSQYLTGSTALDGQCSWDDGIASQGEPAFRLDAVAIQNAQGAVTSKLDASRS